MKTNGAQYGPVMTWPGIRVTEMMNTMSATLRSTEERDIVC